MSNSHEDVVRIASGGLVQIEMYQQALGDAGIESRVVGDDLEGSLGSALQNSIELYVKQADFVRAEKLLEGVEAEKQSREKR